MDSSEPPGSDHPSAHLGKKRAKRGRTKFSHRKKGRASNLQLKNTPRTEENLLPQVDVDSAVSHPSVSPMCENVQQDESTSSADVTVVADPGILEVDVDSGVPQAGASQTIGNLSASPEIAVSHTPTEGSCADVTLCAESDNEEDETHLPGSLSGVAVAGNSGLDVNSTEDAAAMISLSESWEIDSLVSSLKDRLPFPWICLPERDGIHILQISRCEEKAIQRRVFFSFDGKKEVASVHRKPLSEAISKAVFQCSDTDKSEKWDKFVHRVLQVVDNLRQYDICVGVDDATFECFWEVDKNGEVDKNPYGEQRYSTTYRPTDCHLLVSTVPILKRQCAACLQAKRRFKDRLKNLVETPAIHTKNEVLQRSQLLEKMKKQQGQLKYARSQVAKLKAEIQRAIKNGKVFVEEEDSQDLCRLLENHLKEGVTATHQLFLQEQIKAANVKNPSGRRWHPTILRFALLLKTTSSAAYQAARDSGVLILPSERTLYEYSHAVQLTEGVMTDKLNRLCEQLATTYTRDYQQYHVLLMDEMHINKKLVFRKSTGDMIGYVSLSEAETEMMNFEAELKGDKPAESAPPASKMLAFMVRGVASGVSEIVAAYPTTDSLEKEALHDKVWEVIGALERSGIKVIAVVSDGAAANRAFYGCHLPLTKGYNLVFDTVNLVAPERPLFFFSDVPHLLKTIRNCFYKSGFGHRFPRLLTKNKQTIIWQTIRNLYDSEKSSNLRRSYKLNSYNVNLNAYSVMKVNYAAQVMSETVALDLESKNWPGTSETVKFIRLVNAFFDMLNGSYSGEGKRKANANLNPYVDVDDERFKKLLDFVEYLHEWKREVESSNYTASEKNKMLLSRQTMEGIEISVRSFIACTQFLLSVAGVKFVNARVFGQDPLERYFGKQRQSGGGSRNPTAAQFLSNDVKIAIHRDMNVRNSNVKQEMRSMDVSDQPLPKRIREK